MGKYKFLSLLLVLALIASMLCGCGQGPDNAPVNTPGEDMEEGYPVTVDNYGTELSFNKRPSRVITLGPNCTELFAALGLGELVIGRSLVNHSRGALKEYAGVVDAIPQLNYGSVTREAVLTSGADFAYAIDWEIGDEGLNPDEAAGYGITTYVNSADTVEKQFKEIEDLGKIFKIEAEAERFIEEQKTRISAVQEAVKAVPAIKVLVYDSGNNGVFTCSGNNLESELIALAGGENIFGDISDKQWITVSYEEVLLRNPDVIVIHDYDSPSVDEKIAEIMANPSLSQLDCVKNKRFALITLESVLGGDRMAYAVESLAADFYPEIFK